MNEKLIERYIDFVFAFLKDNKEGQGLFFKTIRSKAEEAFSRSERNNLFFIVDLLLRNDYLGFEENNFIYLSRKGFNYLNGDTDLCLHVALEEQLSGLQKSPIDQSEVFSELWTIIGSNEKALYPVSGPAFYNLIKPYLPGLPVSYSRYIAKLREDGQSTSRIDWYEDLFMRLEAKDVIPFIRDISKEINQAIDRVIKSKSDEDDILDITPSDFETARTVQSLPPVEQPAIEFTESPAVGTVDTSAQAKAKCPRVFISYAWEKADEAFMQWALDFAGKLRTRGIDAQIDRYLLHGADVVKFMLDEIRNDDRVICILTPTYKEKAQSGKGGAGYEGIIISHNIYNDQDTTKFIPVLKKGKWETSTPDFMEGRKGFDFVAGDEATEIESLVKVLKGIPVVDIPPIQQY